MIGKDKTHNGWRKTTLGASINIIGGGTPKTTNPEYWDGDIPWLSVVDFNDDYRWVYDTEKKITQTGLENSATSLLKSGDLIISARGTVGALSQLKKPMAFNQSCYGIKEKENISDKNFLYYLVKFSINKLLKNVHGAIFDTITRQTFENIDILLPPVLEQKTIAAVLSSLDDKIELLLEQNQTLEETAQTIFKEWFGKYKVGDELPEGWRVGEVRDMVEIFDSQRIPLSSRERAQRKGKYPYYGATSVMDYVNDYLFEGVYLLLAEDGSVIDENGYPILQYVWGQFWVNNHTHILQGKNGFSTEMIYLFFRMTKVSGIVNGAVQLKINQKNLLGFEIILPPQTISENFSKIIDPLFNKIRLNQDQIQILSTLRDTLLPRLMSGALRVKF